MKHAFVIVSVAAHLSAFSVATPVRAEDILDVFGGAPANGLMSMEDILARARETTDGTVTEIELERVRGKWIYEVEIQSPRGREIELKYDARSGDLLSHAYSRK